MLFGFGQPDEEVGAEDVGDLALEELSDGRAGDSSHDLADEEALGDGVIARQRAIVPPRLLGGEQRRGEVPIGQVLGRDRLLPARESGAVVHEVAHLDGLLAVGGELGPVRGDGRVEVEFAAVEEHQGDEERHGLGG